MARHASAGSGGERVCAPNTKYKKLERKTNPGYMGEQDVGAK